ncbi:probable cationic amino acid transporter isoform X1 [Stylophora pistillata]|uniref:probable cationic amino acid transporter isoform X1 n=1 Tax=Stylophora pistillata TaxID=50429 RepID=UPI000C045628|nr:probable cationic amino acid transporter isoform X1 [Stylophora pistillata]
MSENLEENDEGHSGSKYPSLFAKITRTKPDLARLSEGSLRRSLLTMDLTLLGAGTAIGIGVYIIIPKLSNDMAAPTVILSVILTSLSFILSGICYAEFSSRIPKSGSAYVYCYAVLGEIWAFIVGWTMILEYMIVTAVLARTCSEYIDYLLGGRIYDFFKDEVVTWNYPFLAPFPDFLAFILPVAVTWVIAMGMRRAMFFHHTMLAFSSVALILLFIISLFVAKPDNWTHNNVLPYGVQDILKAAARSYFIFISLDAISSASRETTIPSSSVPLAVILTVTLVTIIYCGTTVIFTLTIPFDEKSGFAPFAKIFRVIPGADYAVTIGAISATSNGLISCSLAAPRVLFTMVTDGLLLGFDCVDEPFSALTTVSFVHGLFSGCLATLFSTEHLIELLSVGTLLAYTMVAISVLLTRYQPGVECHVYGKAAKLERTNQWLESITSEPRYPPPISDQSELEKRDTVKGNTSGKPSEISHDNATLAIFLLVLSISFLVTIILTVLNGILKEDSWAFLAAVMSGIFIFVALIFLTRQPKNNAKFPITVPCSPLLSLITIFVNVLLISELDYLSFVRFGAWLIPGLIIYILYGYRRSKEALKPKESTEGDFILYENPNVDASFKHIQPKRKRDEQQSGN